MLKIICFSDSLALFEMSTNVTGLIYSIWYEGDAISAVIGMDLNPVFYHATIFLKASLSTKFVSY